MNFTRILFIPIVAAFFSGMAFFCLQYFWSHPLSSLEKPRVYVINSGATVGSVSQDFKALGIIKNAWIMSMSTRLFGSDAVFKVGEYRLPEKASLAEVVSIFDRGVGLQHKITFVEGVDCFKLLNDLKNFNNNKKSLDELSDTEVGCELLSSLLSDEAVKMMGGGRHPEGWFLPETYYFPSGVGFNQVLLRAHKAMLEVLNTLWIDREKDLPYKSAYDALIMASIIERETGVVTERAQIAGVFVRRMKSKMRLQTDPTVIYGLGARYNGNLSRSDLKKDTPYNTYTRAGLPPSPIAMPGRDAIYAALHPAPGEAFYFVAKGDGSHHFSATLEEHRAAVIKYQIKHRRADYRSTPDKA